MVADTESIRGVPSATLRLLSPKAEALVLIVPGNPGVAGLYTAFAEQIAALGEGRLSVAVASHAGHAPGHPAPGGFFTLSDQLAHHRAFLDRLPPHPTVHLVGHSIGAWLSLQLLDGLPEAQRGRALLLFPTIERMAQTPAGRRLSPLFGPLRHPAVLLSRLIRRLPARDALLTRALLASAPEGERAALLDGILALSPASLHNVLLMAGEEMETVVDLPRELLCRHAARLTLYYGTADRWNLPGMARGVSACAPEAEVIRCSVGLSHAFVLDDVAAMAELVARRVHSGHADRRD